MRLVMGLLAIISAGGALQHDNKAPDFKPMEFLVGSCWVGTFPNGKETDEHCFEWMYGRHFIRDRHVVRGGEPYEGETIYGVDPETKQLTFWYWSSDGNVMTGRLQYVGDSIVFPTSYVTAKGKVEMKAVWASLGEGGYHITQSEATAQGWKTIWTMEMKRSRRLPG